MEEMEEPDDSSLLAVLSTLELDELDDEWVDNIWYGEFMDNILPPSVARIDFVPALVRLKDSLGGLPSWKRLVEAGVNHRKLTALLFHFIMRGETEVVNRKRRQCGVLAARSYIAMLIIPGSEAYSVFHCQMYVTCLKIFKYADRLLESEEEFNDINVCAEVNLINGHVTSTLKDLSRLIDCFNLKSNSVTLEETISCLVDLTNNPLMSYRLSIEKSTVSRNSKIAFDCIDKLIKPANKNTDQLVIFAVFKFLLPKFTALDKLTRKSLLSSENSGFAYCSTLLSKYGDEAINGFTCFIQHLCCDATGMERQENRSFRVKIIINLMSNLPLQAYSNQLQWIKKLTRNSLATYRTLALEVIKWIVAGEDRIAEFNDEGDELPSTSMDDDEEPAISLSYNVGHKDLLSAVIDRCQDVSGTVRMNALSILVACTAPSNTALKDTVKEIFEDDDTLLQIAVKKTKDDRANVRKSAMKLVENVLMMHEKFLVRSNLQFLVDLCRDASISVRSCAITVLTNLTFHWRNASMADAWLDGVLNQLSDPESKIQQSVLDALISLLISDLKKHSMTTTGRLRFPWILLSGIVRKNMRRHLSHGFLLISKQPNKVLTPNLVEILSTHVRTENNLSCWVLLSCIARHVVMEEGTFAFALEYFHDKSTDTMCADIRLLILVQEVLCEWCTKLTNDEKKSLQDQLVQALHFGTVPSGATRGSVQLAMRLNPNDRSWAIQLMEEYEAKILEEERDGDVGAGIIITLGDVSLAADRHPSPEIIQLLLNMVGSFDGINAEAVSPTSRSAALITLGKFSLRDKEVATKVTDISARLASSTTCALSLRINAMCIMADISIRFTSIVEPKLPGMFMSLASPILSIRQMAVQLITQLLVADFLKLRDTLYFHYFGLVCDPDEKIRDIATYYLIQCLVVRDKNILYNNFINSIFYFNHYEDPMSYKRYNISEEERKLFALNGEEKRKSRYTIYDLMLNHMSNLQRLNMQVRISNQAIAISEQGAEVTDVLRDSLSVLRKISQFSQNKDQGDDLTARVANNIVAQKMKLNDIEKVIPMVMRLYRQLKMISSPLVSNVVGYACHLLKEYKHEAEEVFESDAELLEEIRTYRTGNEENFLLPPDSTTVLRRPPRTPIASSSLTPGRKPTPKKRKVEARRKLNLVNMDNDDH